MCVGAAACSGGSDRLSPGVYTIAYVESVVDECAALPPVGRDTVVTMTDGAIFLFGLPGLYRDTRVSAGGIDEFDWFFFGYDCVEEDYITLIGRVHQDDQLSATLTEEWSAKSGTECADAFEYYSLLVGRVVTLPCKTESKFRLVKIGPPPTPTPVPTPTPTPIPITGTLTTAYGFSAPLSVAGTPGTGFGMQATLDTVPLSAANQAWSCYAPDPPDYPNYDLVASGTGYAFALSVSTSMWTAGPVPIDGLSVTLTVGDDFFNPDITGRASSGFVTLTSAGTVAGSATSGRCAFHAGNLPLTGEMQAIVAARPATQHPWVRAKNALLFPTKPARPRPTR